MYRVLIVDDERLVRNGLKKHFPWQAHKLVVVGEATDGISACEFVKENPVDIVITDVCMKKMNGIELARYLHEHYPHIKLIFISGYDDLDYLKSALKLEAVDYILKAINFEELAVTLDRVRDQIDKEQRRTEAMCRMEEQLTQSIPLLQERFLVSLIRDDSYRGVELGERISFLGLPLHKDRTYIMLAIRLMDFYSRRIGQSERDRRLYELQVRTTIGDLLQNERETILFSSAEDELVVIIAQNDEEDISAHALDVSVRLSRSLEEQIHARVRIGIGQEFTGYHGMYRGYQSALHALSEGYSLQDSDILIDQRNDEPLCEQLERQLLAYIRDLDMDAPDKLGVQLHQIKSVDQLKPILFYLIISMSRIAFANHLSRGEMHYEQLTRRCETLFAAANAEDMIRFVQNTCGLLFTDIKKKRGNQMNLMISSIKGYIKSHFTNDISLNDIAEHVHLSPAYVSQLFKQETGENISTYITTLRIEKAKMLLRDPQEKLYDVSLLIGFSSSAYFTRLFKKHTGMTPSEYRRSVIAPELEARQ